jgi:asparagine synthase (glutamine-hydrolysing)
MCGIAGIVSADPRAVTIERLQVMSDALKHRGPQGDGYWINHNNLVGLGHRRLSIIDLSAAGAQPMHYPGQYTITYNGELYNYLELKKELTSKGYAFTSACDTEVVLAAYACYGKECLQHFDGMFAFAIWNETSQTLFCARDRFGEKPFYYTQHNNQFLFASEMKGLWAAGIAKSMHRGMLLNYLTLGFTNDPLDTAKTFYQGIHALPSAHYLQLHFDNSAASPA